MSVQESWGLFSDEVLPRLVPSGDSACGAGEYASSELLPRFNLLGAGLGLAALASLLPASLNPLLRSRTPSLLARCGGAWCSSATAAGSGNGKLGILTTDLGLTALRRASNSGTQVPPHALPQAPQVRIVSVCRCGKSGGGSDRVLGPDPARGSNEKFSLNIDLPCSSSSSSGCRDDGVRREPWLFEGAVRASSSLSLWSE